MHAIDEYVDLLLSPAPAEPDAAPAMTREPPRLMAAPAAPPLPAPVPTTATAAEPVTPPASQDAAGQRLRLSRWLRLRCGDQVYAVELLKIREVTLPTPLLPLRGVSPAVCGIMNLRGQVVPVLDLGAHFGGSPVADTPDTRIVILQDRHEVLGLRVSGVDDIVPVDPEGIEDARISQLAPVGDQRIQGIARPGGRVMLLLDARRLLATPLH